MPKPSFPLHPLAQLDHRYIWHPFTQMQDWLREEPIVIVSGSGAVLRDAQGRDYLDANSSIWTNLHGHQHRKLNAAIHHQLKKIAHSSALGLANEPASVLASQLVSAANARPPAETPLAKIASVASKKRRRAATEQSLQKVFYSDDGSTALEVALKLSYEFTRRTRGPKSRPRFVSLQGAYHGDTIGAVSLGHINLFHKAYSGLLFQTDCVAAPYCYRCPFNRAKPERADARDYRKCQWECVRQFEQTLEAQKKKRGEPYAAFVFEPLMQGAAGMIPQPSGWLEKVTTMARGHGSLLIADEVMTGFGRTGLAGISGDAEQTPGAKSDHPPLFGTTRVGVQPDFLCLAKGLTGGYLPMAATVTTQAVFDTFLGRYEEFKTFFHGHSYTANQLGAAAAVASLELLQSPKSVRDRASLQQTLLDELASLWSLPHVGDIRQVGLIAGVELVKDWRTREGIPLAHRAGIRVCEAMARRGVLTRPVGNVLVLMPPYCTTTAHVRKMVRVMGEAIEEILGP